MRHVLRLAAFCLPLVAVPAFADCTGEIRQVLHGLMTAGPYTIVTAIKTGDSLEEATTRIIPPSAMRSRSVGGGRVTEMILLDGKAWMNYDGSWSELPPEIAEGMADTLLTEPTQEMVDAQCRGETIVEGKAYLAFSFGYAKSDTSSTITMYVDTHSRLPWRMLVTGKVGDATVKTVTTYSYGGDFDIVAPL